MPTALTNWLKSRLGFVSLLREAFDRPIVGPPRWSSALGHALVWLFVLEALTGFAMANLYAPTTRDAWGSIVFMEQKLAWGGFVRGLHYWAAQLMVVLAWAHCLGVLVVAHHRRPREALWWVSLGTLGLMIGAAHTGALLPWDERAYWITVVEDGIIQGFPGIGTGASRALRNGPTAGTPTLTRMYALHTVALPALIALVFYLRGHLHRHLGLGQSSASEEEVTAIAETRSWPQQTLRDIVVAVTVVALAIALAKAPGAPLDGPADPSMSDYPARPEWYLLWLFRLRKYFDPKRELIATAVIPGLATGALVLLPWLDRTRRKLNAGQLIGASLLIIVGIFTGYSVYADDHDPVVRRGRAGAAVRASAARRFALDGIPPEGPQDLLRNHPSVKPRLLYEQHCGSCHARGDAPLRDARGGRSSARGPALEGFGSRGWARAVMTNPDAPALFGRTNIHFMPPQRDLSASEMADLAEYLYSQSIEPGDPAADAARVRSGDTLFHNQCTMCHQGAGDLTETDAAQREAPDLTRWASRAWIRGQILEPAHPTRYGSTNEMPSFSDELQGRDLEYVIDYVRSMRARAAPSVPPPAPRRE
ncbi:MAG: cytochrome b N-terminal domain-containing protein [Deltaproteobacteria bacterium]|nr:cytochrome b N-terminal domain-containing protein [Deltaproteobacteria bacterium]